MTLHLPSLMDMSFMDSLSYPFDLPQVCNKHMTQESNKIVGIMRSFRGEIYHITLR